MTTATFSAAHMNYNHFSQVNFEDVPDSVLDYVEVLLDREGPYSNDKDDHLTVWGVIQSTADRAGFKRPLTELTKSEAAQIWIYLWYFRQNFHYIAQHSLAICNQVWDTSGPAGWPIGIRHLQRGLNHYNGPVRAGRRPYGVDLAVDGKLGPATANMLAAFLEHRGEEGEEVLFCNINAQQEVHYMLTTQRNPGKRRFSFGWSRGRVVADLRALFTGRIQLHKSRRQRDLMA